MKQANIMAFIFILLAFSLHLQGSLGGFVCENLPVGMCSFAVSSSGNRCLLETRSDETTAALECKTSDVIAGNNLHEHIESDECLMACGLSRKSIGISSDNLLEPRFVGKLCSPRCRRNCLNIVDLYSSLALGEGVYLPKLCKTMERSPRRAMAATNVRSSGAASATLFTASEFAQSPNTFIIDSEFAPSPGTSITDSDEFAQSPGTFITDSDELAQSPGTVFADSDFAQSPAPAASS